VVRPILRSLTNYRTYCRFLAKNARDFNTASHLLSPRTNGTVGRTARLAPALSRTAQRKPRTHSGISLDHRLWRPQTCRFGSSTSVTDITAHHPTTSPPWIRLEHPPLPLRHGQFCRTWHYYALHFTCCIHTCTQLRAMAPHWTSWDLHILLLYPPSFHCPTPKSVTMCNIYMISANTVCLPLVCHSRTIGLPSFPLKYHFLTRTAHLTPFLPFRRTFLAAACAPLAPATFSTSPRTFPTPRTRAPRKPRCTASGRRHFSIWT